MALAEVFEALAGPDAPVEFTAYDGSHAGQAGSPVKITVRSPAAVGDRTLCRPTAASSRHSGMASPDCAR